MTNESENDGAMKMAKNYLEIFGNGDPQKGENLLMALADRLEYARRKHPANLYDKKGRLNSIRDELDELDVAVLFETAEREFDEALDVATTVIRFINHEYY